MSRRRKHRTGRRKKLGGLLPIADLPEEFRERILEVGVQGWVEDPVPWSKVYFKLTERLRQGRMVADGDRLTIGDIDLISLDSHAVGVASDAAQVLDREWFDEHPGVDTMHRPIATAEEFDSAHCMAEKAGGTRANDLIAGSAWTMVRQLAPGVRSRVGLWYPGDNPPTLSDAELLDVLKRKLP